MVDCQKGKEKKGSRAGETQGTDNGKRVAGIPRRGGVHNTPIQKQKVPHTRKKRDGGDKTNGLSLRKDLSWEKKRKKKKGQLKPKERVGGNSEYGGKREKKTGPAVQARGKGRNNSIF